MEKLELKDSSETRPPTDRRAFLAAWFQGSEGQIEIRLLPSGKQKFFSIEDFQGIDDFASKHGKENIYFGVATRNGKGGTKANVISIPGTWADADFKGMPEKEVNKLLVECPLRPTFVIGSGGGYHLYWQYREPTDNGEITERINQQIAQYFQSDPVHNIDRILRLPGTVNHKYEPWRPVKVLIHDPARQYNQSDFEEHLPPLKDTNESGQPVNPTGWEKEVVKGATPGHRRPNLAKEAGRLVTLGLIDEEILPVLLEIDRNNTPPVGKAEVIKTLNGIRKTHDRNHPQTSEINLTQKIRDWIQANTGTFATKDIFEELDISKRYKCQVSTVLTRTVSEGLIERTTRVGIFRVVDKECPAIQWRNTDIETFNINWPLGVENLAQIYHKNIVVLAGETDSGKTAYLLNVVDMNRDKEIFYFSSEMGENEFADRIGSFEGAQANWKKFHLFERSKDFCDVIMPDHINIIDHLELTDAFYLVAGHIGKIFDKLNKGIAIIGLQMDEGAKFGRGRAFSMEKARLYMTMSKNPPDGAILRILKAKKRTRPNVNPNNQRCNFKIINGTRLVQSEPWDYDYKKEGKK